MSERRTQSLLRQFSELTAWMVEAYQMSAETAIRQLEAEGIPPRSAYRIVLNALNRRPNHENQIPAARLTHGCA